MTFRTITNVHCNGVTITLIDMLCTRYNIMPLLMPLSTIQGKFGTITDQNINL